MLHSLIFTVGLILVTLLIVAVIGGLLVELIPLAIPIAVIVGIGMLFSWLSRIGVFIIAGKVIKWIVIILVAVFLIGGIAYAIDEVNRK